MKHPVDRRTFLNSLSVTAAAASAVSATYFAGPRPAQRGHQGQGQRPRHAVQDRPHHVPDRPCQSAGRTRPQGASARGRGDQRRRRTAGQAQDRDHLRRRGGRHRRQRQGASPHEALREDRPVHRRHLQRQHAGARPGRRGARRADDVQRRLHRLPVRQGGAQAEVRVPRDQHPVGRRRHLGGRRGQGLAEGQARRLDPARLQLRPQRA